MIQSDFQSFSHFGVRNLTWRNDQIHLDFFFFPEPSTIWDFLCLKKTITIISFSWIQQRIRFPSPFLGIDSPSVFIVTSATFSEMWGSYFASYINEFGFGRHQGVRFVFRKKFVFHFLHKIQTFLFGTVWWFRYWACRTLVFCLISSEPFWVLSLFEV